MQLAANQRLARNRARLGTGLNLGSLAFLFGASAVSLNQQLAADYPWVPWVGVLVGMGLFLLGQTQTRRWLPDQQQAAALEKAISGLDDRYKLYEFLSTSLPDFILVGPAGAHVLIARPEGGRVTYTERRWRSGSQNPLVRFIQPGMGDPTHEVERGVRAVQSLLATAGVEGIPVAGIVVFTHPGVQLRIDGSAFAVTRLKDLRDVVRRLAGKGANVALSSPRVRELQSVFDQQMKASHSWR